jgi:tetratricopeptide (TPR) repeat protein
MIILSLAVMLLLAACATSRQKLSPQANVNFKTANVYYSQKNVEEAEKYYKKVLADNPDHAIAIRRIADIDYYNAERFSDKAIELNKAAYEGYSKAVRITQGFPNLKEKEQADIRDMENRKKSAWTRIFKKGEDQLAAGNTEDAIQTFKLVSELDPARDEPDKMLFSIYQKDPSKANEAAILADRMYAKDPENPELIRLKGAFHYNKQEFSEALKYFEKIKEIDPLNVNNLLSISVCMFELKDYEGTLQSLQAVLNIEPNNIDALTDAKITAYELGRKELAFDYLKRLIELNQDEDLYRQITALCNEMENYPELIKYAEMWHAMDSSNREPVQWLVHAAGKTKNKTLEKKYNDILKKMK